MADAVDDDTLAAVLARWLADPALSVLFASPPEVGALKSPSGLPLPLPYARLACEFWSRDSAGTAGVFHDYRRVVVEAWAARADSVRVLAALMTAFNRDTVLSLPSTDPGTGLPRFVRWWPVNHGSLDEEEDPARGRDVWRATVEGRVWSVRAAGGAVRVR